jgi:hypothetical protein
VVAVNLLGSRSHGDLPSQRTLFSCEMEQRCEWMVALRGRFS